MIRVTANWFERFYNFLANLGLVLRDDPPKVIDMTGRVWGDTIEGLALSIRELPRDDEGRVTGISVVVKNTGTASRTLDGPLAARYEIEGLARSPYGHQLSVSAPGVSPAPVTLGLGGAIETELPIAAMYEMRATGGYKLLVSYKLADGTALRSNELTVSV